MKCKDCYTNIKCVYDKYGKSIGEENEIAKMLIAGKIDIRHIGYIEKPGFCAVCDSKSYFKYCSADCKLYSETYTKYLKNNLSLSPDDIHNLVIHYINKKECDCCHNTLLNKHIYNNDIICGDCSYLLKACDNIDRFKQIVAYLE